ncbi:MAG TPA: DUF1178 family protein [Aliidongia sp.]|nr:DUF1178 family protein [Aliidongia sp.]
MILYQLKCPAEHSFEGWFRDSAGYEEQVSAGKISCPVCGDTSIGKAPMAPRVMRGKNVHSPAETMQMLRKLRRTVEENCENVGENFAEEARKIHYGETESRAIYGDATAEQADELADEGIEFGRIPWLPLADT